MFKLPENVPSKYLFVLLAAERAKQLQRGCVPMVKTGHVKPTYRAVDELMDQKVEFMLTEKTIDAQALEAMNLEE
ncbi:MAG: DNA-directed RNA polymerase subunit omega [Acidobacteria bacterium]|nr:DNA-directed RNA polymerase subunit omega [Acidobacteriota bacterium]